MIYKSSPKHIILFTTLLLVIFTSCISKTTHTPAAPEITIPSAYEAIQERGDTIVALAVNNTTSYFLWKGNILGYEYELLKKFANHKGWHLKIKLVEHKDSLLTYLKRGEGDIVANTIAVTNPLRKEVSFSKYLYSSPIVLIQRKPNNWENLLPHQIDNRLIRDVLDIDDNAIYVPHNSLHYTKLLQLGDDIGDSLNIITVDKATSDFDLIDLVAKREIDYTIANREIASIYASYYDIIDYGTAISMPQKKSWAVRKNSPKLLDEINSWLKNYQRYKEYYFIYDKYYNNPNTYRKLNYAPYSSNTGKLSIYDDIIKNEVGRISWDWRLLAAMIYQESQFDNERESWMGAIGLMQVMPTTGEMHGEVDIYDAKNNVKIGVDHIEYIMENFAELDSINKIKFTLGAYNVGLGHIYDAQRIAKHLGNNPNIWDGNVAEALLLKSKKEYYQLPICKNGYCRGIEPYNYVNEILERYNSYIHFIK